MSSVEGDTLRPLPKRLLLSSSWGLGTGAFFWVWALGARAVGRIDPGLTAVDLAARYVGLSVAVFVGMGALAPILRRGWAATLYAGIFGVGFAMLAVSLVGDIGVGWIVYSSFIAAPMFAWSFSKEIRKGAESLCESSDHPSANQSP